MPEIQIIPAGNSAFQEGADAALSVGEAFAKALSFKQQYQTQNLQNQIASQQLKQTVEMAPLQKALMQANVDKTYADIDAIKSGTSLAQKQFDLTSATETQKLSLAQSLGKAQVAQITQGIASDRQKMDLQQKLTPSIVAQAKATLDQTQAQTQALKDDSQYKFTIASQAQQRINLENQNMQEDAALKTWMEYMQMKPEQRAAAQKSTTLGKYVQGFPTQEEDLQPFVTSKVREMLQQNPKMFAKVIGAMAAQMALPGDDKNKAEMYQQMQAIFNKTMTKKQSVQQQMEEGAKKVLGVTSQDTTTDSGESPAQTYTPPDGQSTVPPSSATSPVKSGLDMQALQKFIKVDSSGTSGNVNPDYSVAGDVSPTSVSSTVNAPTSNVTVNKKALLAEATKQIVSSKTPALAMDQFESEFRKYLSDNDIIYLAQVLRSKGVNTAPQK